MGAFCFGVMEKIIVYPASELFHNDVMPAVNSALVNSGVDSVWIMTDTDRFPNKLPDNVHTLNVAKQEWFKYGSPNFRNQYAFICLVRVALTKMFPDADRILSLDADTIITKDITELWDLDMSDYYLAGVPETKLSAQYGKPYINMGMGFFNLEKIRADGMDEQMIWDLQNTWYQWVEQDCINKNLSGRILPLSSIYNASQFTGMCENPSIRHFAYEREWRNDPLVRKYRKGAEA